MDGLWGSVCRDGFWDNNDASVVCKQLGFSPYGMYYHMYCFNLCIVLTQYSDFIGSLAIQSTYYNNYYVPTFFTGLNCNGSEDHLFNCAINTSAPTCSSTWNDANVICPG